MSSSAATAYVAILLVVGLAMAIYGSIMPLGGGTAVMVVGAAAIGAGLTLIGVRLMRSER